MPVDRRVARTRSMLHHALMALIRDKGYDAITVQDICDAADVGRSTFYAHYTGKDDLKRSGLEHMRRALVDRLREARQASVPREPRLGFSLPLLEHARDHRDLYRARAGDHGGAVALGVIRQVLFELVREEFAAPGDAIERELAVQYVVGAYMAVLTWWLDGDAKLPPQEVDAVFRRLATEGVVSSG